MYSFLFGTSLLFHVQFCCFPTCTHNTYLAHRMRSRFQTSFLLHSLAKFQVYVITHFFFIFPSWLTNNNLFSHNSEKFKIMVPVDSSPSLITIFSLQPHLAGDWVISIIQKPSMAHLTGVIRSSLILPPHYLCTLCPLFSLLIFLNSISSFAPTRIPPLQEAFPGVFSS